MTPPEIPPDPRTQLFGPGLAALGRLIAKPEPACRKLLGLWLKATHDNAPAILAILAEAERARPAEPAAWITAAVRQIPHAAPSAPPRPSLFPPNPPAEDPWGMDAWIATLPDAVPGTYEGKKVPSINGFVLHVVVETFCSAAKIPPAARPRLDAIADWCRADLYFDAPRVLAEVRRQSASMRERGDIPRSLAVFDATVRNACAAMPPLIPAPYEPKYGIMP